MRDDFNQDTKTVLAHRANLICSNPHCEATTGGPQVDPAKAMNLGVAAHITAASEGGARYDAELTPEQRGASVNGIWLCQNCAKKVDNDPAVYPAELLHAWKTMREVNARNSIGRTAHSPVETEAQRKLKKLLEYKGHYVMQVKMPDSQTASRIGSRPWGASRVKLLECTDFYIVIKGDEWDRSRTIPLDNLKIGWDANLDTLEIMEYD